MQPPRQVQPNQNFTNLNIRSSRGVGNASEETAVRGATVARPIANIARPMIVRAAQTPKAAVFAVVAAIAHYKKWLSGTSSPCRLRESYWVTGMFLPAAGIVQLVSS